MWTVVMARWALRRIEDVVLEYEQKAKSQRLHRETARNL